MDRRILNTLGICLIAALGLMVWGGFGLNAHLIKMLDGYAVDPTPTLNRINQAMDTINRPCATDAEKSAKKDHPCGTLGNIDKGIVKVGDLLATSQFQERDIAKAAEHNMAAVDGLAAHLNKTADALTGTANGATGTLQQAQVDLTSLNTTIAAGKPLLDAATLTVSKAGDTTDSLNAILKDNAIHQTLDNTAVISGNFAATTTDFQTRFHTLLFPPPCHTFGCKLGKAFTIIKDASQLAEPAYFGVQAFKAATQ